MPEDKPEIQMVDVTRHDVTLTMDDILAPLTTTAERLKVARLGLVNQPDVAAQLEKFTELVNALRAVARDLDQKDPLLLQSKPDPAPDLPK